MQRNASFKPRRSLHAGHCNDVSKALMGGTANAGTDNKDGGKENESMLSQFGRDLTKLAKDGKIDPVIGRQKEIERVIQILSRRTKTILAL